LIASFFGAFILLGFYNSNIQKNNQLFKMQYVIFLKEFTAT
jgi:hypothetical protein